MNEYPVTHAAVRPPGASFVRAISSSRAAIDVALAGAQHAEYRAALAAAGLRVEVLPSDERYPDSCFMQDPALVIGGQGIVCRMAAAGRQGEEEGAAAVLRSHDLPLAYITKPGTLEGGDVLVLPGQVLVGITGRSNLAGIAQLAEILEPLGLNVAGLPVSRYLHLLSAVTYVGRNTVLAVGEYVEHPAFARLEVICVPKEEEYAVNSLGLDGRVICPAGYPGVAAMLRAHGFDVLPVPTGEFEKADGGVTCLSLVW